MAPGQVRRPRPPARVAAGMAKDTEKLIRQLSLISYLMAERRPVTAPEIRRDVEGYSVMNEDAFARRFYADRSELEALGIVLSVEKPVDGLVEQENYSLPPENFHLPPIEFTDQELAALRTALQLLDGEFAYAEPLRLALQQISWGRPSPLSTPGAEHGRARDHRLGGRPRRLPAAGQDRDRDLPPQDDRLRVPHDGARRHRHASRRPLPAALPGRPVLRRGPLARARRDPGVPPVAHPGQGRLRHQGRARLPAPRQLRPPRLRQPDRLAVRRAGGQSPRSGSAAGSPGRSSVTSAATARSAPPATTTCSSSPPTPTPASSSPGCWAWARTRASSVRPSWWTSCASVSGCSSSATPASRRSPTSSPRRPVARSPPGPTRPAPHAPMTTAPARAAVAATARTATATGPMPPSAPSASPGW